MERFCTAKEICPLIHKIRDAEKRGIACLLNWFEHFIDAQCLQIDFLDTAHPTNVRFRTVGLHTPTWPARFGYGNKLLLLPQMGYGQSTPPTVFDYWRGLSKTTCRGP